MEIQLKDEIRDSVRNFRLPGYQEIPDIGLFLEQTTKFVSEYLAPFESISITGSMISNYVKKKIIANPVKKQYYREQIADILFIAIAKTVISLDEAQMMLEMQREYYTCQEAYEYFCREFENVLLYVFGLKDGLDPVGTKHSDEKELLRNIIITVVYKIYLDQTFKMMKEQA